MNITKITSNLLAILIVCLLTMGATSRVNAANFDKGMEAYKKGDYQTALNELEPLAAYIHKKTNLIKIMFRLLPGIILHFPKEMKPLEKAETVL